MQHIISTTFSPKKLSEKKLQLLLVKQMELNYKHYLKFKTTVKE